MVSISSMFLVSVFQLAFILLTDQEVGFQTDIRPIMMEHCAECHGGVKKSSGFSVLTRESMLNGGDSGQAGFLPGNSDASSMMMRLRSDDLDERMPPEGHDALTLQQIEKLARWINADAPWPVHWSFSPVQSSDIPDGIHPVDYFVQQTLESKGLTPSPQAEPQTLLRRLSLDLTGLLPDQALLHAFLADTSEAGYELVVDQLLASPHFGERWGRHWLDEARYADSLGYEKDSVKKDAWRYRDWVVNALNKDLPFDVFSRLQLAGDLMPDADPEALLATKLHLQTQFNLEGGIDAEEYRVKLVVDRVNMVSSTWLGITMACSQCHDHPYDAVSQREFYAFYAFFNNMGVDAAFLGKHEGEVEGTGVLNVRRDIAKALEALLQRQISDKNLNNQTVGQLGKLFNFDNDKGLTRFMRERVHERRETFVMQRGDFLRPDIKQGSLMPNTPGIFPPLRNQDQNVDRLDLADWLLSGDHPLTARVTVNKVWMRLFGHPLVDTVQDFGSRGSEPTHPELLDWMAEWWVNASHWSLKRLIKWVVMSETYRQSSAHRPELRETDPENRLLARQNRLRVEAEIIRDISLQTAGLLNFDLGGPSVFHPIPEVVLNQSFTKYGGHSEGRNRYRRGIYTFFRRTAIDPNLMVFDCPDASASRAVRDRSNNALQAMTTLNNEVFLEAAQHGAFKILAAPLLSNDTERMTHVYQTALSRDPSLGEREQLTEMLHASREWFQDRDKEALELMGPFALQNGKPAEQAAWVTLLRLILNLDEFLTRE